MLVSSYVNGFGGFSGGFSEAPSMLQLILQAQQAARNGFGRGFGHSGFGALSDEDNRFLAFSKPGGPSSFVSDDRLVFCNKDRANRPQCLFNKVGEAAKAPIRDMQRAIDRIIDLIPTNRLAGRQLKGQMPDPNNPGKTSEQIFTVPTGVTSPLATGRGGGIDGIVGDTTMLFGVMALTLAGMLKAFPNPGISAAFVSPTRNDIWAKFSAEIASFLNDVANNFAALVAAFNARGNKPIQTQLDVETIPFVVPLAGEKKKSNLAPIVTAAAAMIGLTAIAAVSAAKKKPDFAYESDTDFVRPALGDRPRGYGRRSRLRARGW